MASRSTWQPVSPRPIEIGGLQERRPAAIRRCAPGGGTRWTRSIDSFPTSAASSSRPTPKASRARRTTAARTPTAPTCWPTRSRRTAASSCGARSCTRRIKTRGSGQAGLRRVRAARRQVSRQRAAAGEERRHRLSAARARPSAVRRHAEDALDAGTADHQGIPGLRDSPGLPRPAVRRDIALRYLCHGAQARPSPRSSTDRCSAMPSGMAGVSNIGADRNWTGSQFDQANWYVFGRLAWDPDLHRSRDIAEEWVRMTFSNDPRFVAPVVAMMMGSREAAVDYMTPLGSGTPDGRGASLWPGAVARRRSRAPTGVRPTIIVPTREGIGFDRTATGSNAVSQYAAAARRAVRRRRSARRRSYLLWFHHVPWDYRMASGGTRCGTSWCVITSTASMRYARCAPHGRPSPPMWMRSATRKSTRISRHPGAGGALVARCHARLFSERVQTAVPPGTRRPPARWRSMRRSPCLTHPAIPDGPRRLSPLTRPRHSP